MLKKVFASFSCALLIFSASVLPCFANDKVTGSDITVNTDGTLCTVEAFVNIIGAVGDFPVPVNELLIMDTGYDATTVPFPVVPSFESVSNFILTEDVTLYWRVTPFLYDELGVSNANIWMKDNINTYLPKVYVGSGYNGVSTPDQPTTEVYVDALSLGNGNYGNVGCRAYRCTIPAIRSNGYFTEQFTIVYPGFDESDPNGNHAHWNTQGAVGSLFLDIPLFQFVHTTDKTILSVLDRILAEAEEANVNLNNILGALDSIIVELTDLGLTVDEIAECLEMTYNKLGNIEVILGSIDSNVNAIYYLLTESLKQESQELSDSANEAVNNIDNINTVEDFLHEGLNGSFDTLFNFATNSDGVLGVGTFFVPLIFNALWQSLGPFVYIYLFSMLVGLCGFAFRRIR